MRFFKTLLLFSLLSAFLLAGCVREEDKARTVTDRFLSAIERGDRPALEQTMTARARTQTGSPSSTLASHDSDGKHSIGTPQIQGDEAVVPVTLTDEDGNKDAKIRLRREGGEWRVYAMAIPTFPGGSDFTIDFENPSAMIGEGFRAFGEAMGQFARGMEQGAGEFQKGFEKGYGKPMDSTPSAPPAAPVFPPMPPVSGDHGSDNHGSDHGDHGDHGTSGTSERS